jgi:response regulator RpfG family c-di-GMP phosphodiesterase
MTSSSVLLEITLSDWTPSVRNPTYKNVKIFQVGGKIMMSQLVNRANNRNRLPDKIISDYIFTPLQIGFLKQNLETIEKSTKAFVISLPPLGLEYDLEKCIINFEHYIKDNNREITLKVDHIYKDCIFNLKNKNETLEKEVAQLERNCNKYKYEYKELSLEYNRLYDTSLCAKYVDLLNKTKQLESLLEKEKFEKEQFIAYCNNLNEKIMELTDEKV